jgi:hypothetical protein
VGQKIITDSSNRFDINESYTSQELNGLQTFHCLLIFILSMEIQLWEGDGIPFNGLTPSHCCVCPKPEPGIVGVSAKGFGYTQPLNI